jgi:hypothetical protein
MMMPFCQCAWHGGAPAVGAWWRRATAGATGADLHRAQMVWSGCVDGSNGVGVCGRRRWDSGSLWSLCGGCVVDQGPPHVRAGGSCGDGCVIVRISTNNIYPIIYYLSIMYTYILLNLIKTTVHS